MIEPIGTGPIAIQILGWSFEIPYSLAMGLLFLVVFIGLISLKMANDKKLREEAREG